MTSAWLAVGTYCVLMVLFAIWARRDVGRDDESYYLAGRSLAGPILLATMAATNFSAFTVYGASGAAYRIGLSFLPIMAFGTGFMAVSMYSLGKRARALSAKHGAMTAPEMIFGQTGSKQAQKTMASVLVIATIPYLALQPRAAGIVVSALFGGPEWIGAVLVTILVVAYTLTGGLKAVVRTDLAQGLIALILLWVGLALVVNDAGGLQNAMSSLASSQPSLLGREGNYTLLIWSCTLLLWFFADPMFPQLYQRLCAAKSDEDIGFMAKAYPAIAWLAFLPPILIGALGHLEFSGMDRAGSDNILPMQIMESGGVWLGGLVLVAGLAALMSTMDSQLLATGSLVTRDLLSKSGSREGGQRDMVIIALAVLGLILSLWSDLSILDLGLLAFSMYAVLFPSVYLAAHFEELDGRAVIASILSGEAMVLLAVEYPAFYSDWWIEPVGPAMPTIVIPSLLVAILVLVVVNHVISNRSLSEVVSTIVPSRSKFVPALGLLAVFILAHDYWWWEENATWLLGIPVWIWWAAALSVVQTGIMSKMTD
ncbi:MAG TPA: sodium:solute symporter family protein [Candidatus Poseidoniales archaeon]|nr:MAG TPA: sodium:solute symporter family protein [Candidatus Poseidoniales archaeon]HIH55748.1 sodium:solute symporter family protein [Candidatus Thalassarchaeum sp.]